MRRSCAWAFTAPLLNPAPSAIAFDIVFREAFREVERVVLNSLLSTRAIGRLNLRDRALEAKAKEFWEIIKIGRTHLMDATPIRLGQEFSGYAQQVTYARERAQKSMDALRELALGGTAVGTGLNRHVDLPGKMLRHLGQRTGIAFYEAKNHFEAQGGKDAVVEVSGHLKTIAVSLFKIANDIRWIGSGPRCG